MKTATCIVGSLNPVKVGAVNRTLSLCFPDVSWQVEGMSVPSGVAEQPLTDAATREGAVNRVNAVKAKAHADWYVAIEGGVDCFDDGPATFAYIAICHDEQWSVGRSAHLPLPASVYQALQQGAELGPLMDKLFDTDNIKQKGGAISLLTNNLATRQSVYELAMLLAMAKFLHPARFTD